MVQRGDGRPNFKVMQIRSRRDKRHKTQTSKPAVSIARRTLKGGKRYVRPIYGNAITFLKSIFAENINDQDNL